MKVKIEKNSKEWNMFSDYWKLLQEVWGIEESEEYWQGVRDKVEEFSAKYGTFGISLSVALLDELERRSRNNESRR